MAKRRVRRQSNAVRRVRKRSRTLAAKGNLQFEQLEERRVLTGPTLLGVSADDGSLLVANDVLQTSPSELTLTFGPGQVIDLDTLSGIQIVAAGGDGVIGVDDAAIVPGYVGPGESPNEIVVRFSEQLPDDTYQLQVGRPLANAQGEAYVGDTAIVDFEIDLGATVVAVVPQPVTVNADGSLTQRRDQIVVHFNNDDLNPVSAQNRTFYQLIWTGHANEFGPDFDTVNNLDDSAPVIPTDVVYNAATDTATLTFASNIEDIAGAGTYRLRVGTSEQVRVAPMEVDLEFEPGETVSTASSTLGTLGNQSLIVSDFIGSPNLPDGVFITPPGGENDPGHRLANGFDRHVLGGPDSDEGIPVFVYNFAEQYGLAGGQQFSNLITEPQKDLARQIFDIYSYYLGIEFVETEQDGTTIATGSLEAYQSGAGVTVVGSNFDESFGGDWFQQAMAVVGFQLGLGIAGDLPAGTIMAGPEGEFLGEVDGAISPDPRLSFGIEPEPIFPGDHDIVHAQHMYFPTSDDVDMYRFTLSEPGTISLETFAERAASASGLDTVMRLFRGADEPVLLAQNDDYFGSDSFLEMELQPGEYFVGISSAGNESYDPAFATFTGGRSTGEYDLRVEFRSTANNAIVDETGRRFDGDNDGVEGGVHNFWFRAQTETNTHFVNKAAGAGGDGSLATPYNNIQVAMNAASAGDIVRVVGNNFADNKDAPTEEFNPLTNDRGYEIGIGSTGNRLSDGGVDGILRVEKGVTLMVDGGALFKMRRGAILVGSDTATIDKSGGAIQLLGTPDAPVTFTSLNDETIGVDTTPLISAPLRGDWGGIIIRNDASRAAGQFDYEDQGIFLNYINHADMRYGGGILSVNSVAQEVNPVTIIDARPTIANSDITFSASAAVAASPDSFEETNFRAPEFQSTPFTPDFARVGPDIYGNRLDNNAINGMLIVDRGINFDPSLVVTSSARFDDTSIVHVITENLFIDSSPGGLFQDQGSATGRLDARLTIDAGTVVKLDRGLIEVGLGANFYAEGSADNPVVFTSVADSRYGAGGTFQTSLPDGGQSGDWGGIFLHPTSRGSFDHAVFAYGGGVAPIEGNFAGFSVVEVYQADARITNSTFEFNGNGLSRVDTGNRNGRGENAPGTILVRGAQPIIVDNLFRDNLAATVNINVNALNHHIVIDQGRQTGDVDRIEGFLDNQGPLIRNNIQDRNGINGMVVRGGTLTTEGVWDDTDMTHVVYNGIYVPNFHTFGGLRLKSSQTESLVIKLDGEQAGFITTGTSIGIPDHIGGSIQVIGQPGRPVVLTSLFDDTVGAGLNSAGATQADTNNGGRPVRSVPLGDDGFQINVNFGPSIQANPEVMDAVLFAVDVWEEQLQDPISVTIDIDTAELDEEGVTLTGFPGASTMANPTTFSYGAQLFETTPNFTTSAYGSVQQALVDDAGAHESIVGQLPTLNELNVQYPANTQVPFATAADMRLTTANAKALGIATEGVTSDGTILINEKLDLFDYDRTNGTLTYREDFQSSMLREIGRILGFSSSLGFVNGFLEEPLDPDPENPDLRQEIFLTPLDLFRFAPGDAADDFTGAPRLLDPQIDEQVFYAGGDVDLRDWPYENILVGEVPIEFGSWREEYLNRNGELTILEPIGVMDRASILRDGVLRTHDSLASTQGLVVDFTEADKHAFDAIGWDVVGPTPGAWRGITMHELTYDGNVEYILEAEAPATGLELNSTPGTAQSVGSLAPDLNSGNEVRRLGFEVHGVIGTDSDIDVYSFTAAAGTEAWIDLDQTSRVLDSVVSLVDSAGNVLASSDDSLRETNGVFAPTGIAQTFARPDIYSVNIQDAGMSVTLPGPAGFEGEFYVQVESFDAASAGRYELQIRLKEQDVVPGTTVQYSDIRYAKNGIKIYGPPSDSPLVGEQSEDESINDGFEESLRLSRNEQGFVVPGNSVTSTDQPYEVSAQALGNVLASRQGAISVAGSLEGFGDVDWYSFEVASNDYASLQGTANEIDLIFDIDYADGLGRADTFLTVFRQNGFSQLGLGSLELVYYGDTSNLTQDQTGSSNDLDGGSYGTDDPYIGPVSFPLEVNQSFQGLGRDLYNNERFFVAVTPAGLVPEVLLDPQTTLAPVLGDESGSRGFGVFADTLPTFLDPTRANFVFDPSVPGAGTETGLYQLEIRVAHPDAGDSNRERLQGQLLISNNFITDSQEFGISIEEGLRDLPVYGGFIGDDVPRIREVLEHDTGSPSLRNGSIRQQHGQFTAGDYAPHSGGVPRNLPNVNEQRILPGITVANNVISNSFEGGVQVAGDPGGFVVNTYDLEKLFEIFDRPGCGDAENAEFSVWDHQGNIATFDFVMGNGPGEDGKIPIRYDCSYPPDAPNADPSGTVQTTLPPPTLPNDLRAEIEHALRLSDLDIKVHSIDARQNVVTVPTGADGTEDIPFTESATLFIEGAARIGLMDVAGGKDSIFIPGDLHPELILPFATAFIAQQGAVPYARIVNNTLVGRGGDLFDGNGRGDIGITVEDNASPTLINNIVSNFAVGIRSDFSANDSAQLRPTFLGNDFPSFPGAFDIVNFADNDAGTFANGGNGFDTFGGIHFQERNVDEDFISAFPIEGARPTVVSSNVYQGNLNDSLRINEGSNALILANSEPLFVDAAGGSYFLEANSRALNSSTAFLDERGYLGEVQSTVGLTPTQIVAPRVDALGILRDAGFADRGALERSDFVGPTAQLIDPVALPDDPTSAIATSAIASFTVQLLDGASLADPVFGSGVNDTTIDLSTVMLLEDGVPLVQGVDYLLTYNSVNDFLLFTPAAGAWPTNRVYEIVLDNTMIADNAGNLLQPNQSPSGATSFTITTGSGTDFGDAPESYGTLIANDGARHVINPTVFLGGGVTADGDGKPSSNASADTRDDGVTLPTLFPGSTASILINASAAGFVSGWVDFNDNGTWADAGEQFVIDRQVNPGPNQVSVTIPQGATLGSTFARFRFSTQSALGVNGEAPDGEVEDYVVNINTSSWQNTTESLDVNGDGNIAPIDINIIITELTLHAFSDPATGELQASVPVGANFYDVNGDGFVSPRDALAIINFLAINDAAPLLAPMGQRESAVAIDWTNDDEDETSSLTPGWIMDEILDDLADDVGNAWEQV